MIASLSADQTNRVRNVAPVGIGTPVGERPFEPIKDRRFQPAILDHHHAGDSAHGNSHIHPGISLAVMNGPRIFNECKAELSMMSNRNLIVQAGLAVLEAMAAASGAVPRGAAVTRL